MSRNARQIPRALSSPMRSPTLPTAAQLEANERADIGVSWPMNVQTAYEETALKWDETGKCTNSARIEC